MKSEQWEVFYRDFVSLVDWHPFLSEGMESCSPSFGNTDQAARLIDLHPRFKKWFDLFHPASKKSRFLDDSSSESQSEGEEEAGSEVNTAKVMRLVGKSASRNTLGALIVLDKVVEAWPKEDSGQLKSSDYLTYSTELQEFCEDHRLPHSELAFEVGLAIDILQAKANARKDWKLDMGKVRTQIDTAVRSGQILLLLGQKLKRFDLELYAFGIGIWWALSKISMSLLFPVPYGEFEKEWPFWKNNLYPESWQILQKKHFGTTFFEVASCFALASRSFQPSSSSFRTYETPLSLLFRVSTTLSQFERDALLTAKKLPLSQSHLEGLNQLGLGPKSCIDALKSMKSLGAS